MSAENKTVYRFTTGNPAMAEQVIQQWLAANGFELIEENGEKFYRTGTALNYRFFEYYINGGQGEIYVYLNSHKRPWALGDDMNVWVVEYKKSLEPLFVALDNLEREGGGVPLNPASQPLEAQNKFRQSVNKQYSNYAEIAFWFSIFSLFFSFFGMIPGIILLITDYGLAIMGLKTPKRKKAIAAIVISSIAVAIFIIQLLVGVLKQIK